MLPILGTAQATAVVGKRRESDAGVADVPEITDNNKPRVCETVCRALNAGAARANSDTSPCTCARGRRAFPPRTAGIRAPRPDIEATAVARAQPRGPIPFIRFAVHLRVARLKVRYRQTLLAPLGDAQPLMTMWSSPFFSSRSPKSGGNFPFPTKCSSWPVCAVDILFQWRAKLRQQPVGSSHLSSKGVLPRMLIPARAS